MTKKEYALKVCKRCRAPFPPRGPNSKYCDTCRQLEQARRAYKRRQGTDRTCRNCGDTYRGSNRSKYCPKCRPVMETKNRAEAIKEYHQRIREERATMSPEDCTIAFLQTLVHTCKGNEPCDTCFFDGCCPNQEEGKLSRRVRRHLDTNPCDTIMMYNVGKSNGVKRARA